MAWPPCTGPRTWTTRPCWPLCSPRSARSRGCARSCCLPTQAAGQLRDAGTSGRVPSYPPPGISTSSRCKHRRAWCSPTRAACRRKPPSSGVPCLTLRANTERPMTLTEGTNQLVGRDPDPDRRGGQAGARDSRGPAAAGLVGWPRRGAHSGGTAGRRDEERPRPTATLVEPATRLGQPHGPGSVKRKGPGHGKASAKGTAPRRPSPLFQTRRNSRRHRQRRRLADRTP